MPASSKVERWNSHKYRNGVKRMFSVPDAAWKFGCGRYIQKANAIKELAPEVERIGGRPLLLAGEKAWMAAKDVISAGLRETDYAVRIHRGPCSEEAAREYADAARHGDYGMIVGVGGGTLMDTAKLAAYLAKLPIINIPTISATCAAYTPLSVVYTPEGKTRGSWFFENEVNCILADLDLLSRQPLRCAAAGVADSMAKMIEIRHNIGALQAPVDIMLAKVNAEYIYTRLAAIAGEIAPSLEGRAPSPTLEEMVYLTIPATGIVSGAARGLQQSALGHCLYESVRIAFTEEAAGALHGELVGIGLRVLLAYDCQPRREFDAVMRELFLPTRLSQVGVPATRESVLRLADTILSSLFAKDKNYDRQRIEQAIGDVL